MAPNDVYGVASFYSYLHAHPKGRHVIKICKSLPCHLSDYEMVVEELFRQIGIRPGQTTSDGRFSLVFTNCIGLCDNSPAMLVDDRPHTNLQPSQIPAILSHYK
jgi:NADH-quinone oxidoreductase subunit E